MISKTVLRWLTLVALVGLSLGVMVPAASAATSISACPFTITVPGLYEVTKNLTATGTDCIIVHSSGVAIDMKGHKITGDGTHAGITSAPMFVDAVAISHGAITKFGDGIILDNSSDLITLEKLDVSDNKFDGIRIDGCCNSITDIKANNNGDDGVQVDDCCNLFKKITANDNGLTNIPAGEGIEEEDCCNTFDQITASRNGDDGIENDGCCTGISRSQANDNKHDGINMFSSDQSVANVRTSGNKSIGIHISGSDSHVTDSTANDNGADGIDFGSSDEDVSDSTANHNASIGMDLGNSDFNTATDVTANNNATGVKLEAECNAVNVRAHNNSVKNLDEIGPCTNLLNSAP